MNASPQLFFLVLSQIVSGAYDFVNFIQSPLCLVYGNTVFPHCNDNSGCINEKFLSYLQNVLMPLQAQFPNNFHVMPFFGLLQEAGGSSLTPPPYPNDQYPSPEKYMNDGCIHASNEGWSILMNFLYDNFFKNRLEQGNAIPVDESSGA